MALLATTSAGRGKWLISVWPRTEAELEKENALSAAAL